MPELQNVNALLPWEQVCRALGIPISGKALPVCTRCPVCGSAKLHLFHDTSHGGAWHQCHGCKSSGDMLELACRLWEIPPSQAVHRLAAMGVSVPEAGLDYQNIATYVDTHHGGRARLAALWTAAQREYAFARTDTLQRIKDAYRLWVDIDLERWLAGPGQLLGATTRLAAEAAFGSGFFPGAGWTDALVLPFHDLPDRVSGMLFFGRRGRRPQDVIFRRAPYARIDRAEAGLLGLPAAHAYTRDKTVVAFEDWATLLRFQVRASRTRLGLLPLVGWYADHRFRTQKTWAALADRTLVFWCATLTPATLLQAVETEGQISVGGLSATSVRNAMTQLPDDVDADRMLRLVTGHAKPWPVALKQHLGAGGEVGAGDFVSALEAMGADVSYILRRCGRGAAPVAAPASSIQYGRTRIYDRNDSWHAHPATGGSYQLLNCVLRAVNVVKDAVSGTAFYCGCVRHNGKTADFVEPVETFQDAKQLWRWLSAFMLRHELGVPVCTPRWKTHLHGIMVQFREPVFVTDNIQKWKLRLPRSL